MLLLLSPRRFGYSSSITGVIVLPLSVNIIISSNEHGVFYVDRRQKIPTIANNIEEVTLTGIIYEMMASKSQVYFHEDVYDGQAVEEIKDTYIIEEIYEITPEKGDVEYYTIEPQKESIIIKGTKGEFESGEAEDGVLARTNELTTTKEDK